MRLSHLRRPLFLALLAYAAWLCVLKNRGRFDAMDRMDASLLAPREPARVTGRVATLPTQRKGRQEFLLDVEKVDGAERLGRSLVRLASPDRIDLGDRLTVAGRLSHPPSPLFPGAPSWRGYLQSVGVRSIVRADRLGGLQTGGILSRTVSAFHQRMLDSFRNFLPPDDAAVLGGIVLGDKTALSRKELDAFRDAGAIYLLVTSGLHVNFVLLGVAWTLRKLGCPRPPAVLAGLLAGAFYTLAAGAGPPLVRAYAMTVAAAVGWTLDRDSGAFQGLVLAAWALLLIDPPMLFQAGFQMSCAATFAILAVIAHWRVPRSWPLPVRWTAEAVLVSTAAQLAMAPLSAAYFHRVSAIGYLCNAALVPPAMALIGFGFVLFGASLSPWDAPARLVAWAAGLLLRIFRAAVAWFGGLPGAAVWVPTPSGWLCAAFSLVLIAALGATDTRRARALAWAGAACLIPLLPGLSGSRPFEVSSSSKASTALVGWPDGRNLLVNAGLRGDDLAHAVLSSGRRSIDEVRLTGLSRRRWKGLLLLADAVAISRVVAPLGEESPGLAEVRRTLQSRGVEWDVDRSRADESDFKVEWGGISAVVGRRGVRFGGDFEQFDILGPFERRPRGAMALRFDGSVARMTRPT